MEKEIRDLTISITFVTVDGQPQITGSAQATAVLRVDGQEYTRAVSYPLAALLTTLPELDRSNQVALLQGIYGKLLEAVQQLEGMDAGGSTGA